MTWPADVPFDRILTTYVVANTPTYLFKRLRALSEVQSLAERQTTLQLAAAFGELLSNRERTPTDIAKAYALLVAISLRNYAEWSGVVEILDFDSLDWGKSFYDLLRSK